ncbi:LytTR family DNA-binding domain-containing protein [Clostridiaceae bacterium M8S5]|nr:LytTR family DNA-binding domain-containing protein [Clostridiaceae bacterium M8S5]
MVHIAICDDNIIDVENIEKRIKNIQQYYNEKIMTYIYYSGETFCDAIYEKCPFDIVIMDIEMEGMNGIDAAKKLRSNDDNDFVLLIYLSNHDNYLLELFDVQPYGFIQKPIDANVFYNKLRKAVDKTIRYKSSGKRLVLPVTQKGRELLVPFDDIIYLESRIRVIYLFTSVKVIRYYGKLNNEELKLSAGTFVRTHQSYLVNLKYIKVIYSDMLILIDGTEIPISNNKRQLVKETYLKYRRNYFE